jgi:hypothetical protein
VDDTLGALVGGVEGRGRAHRGPGDAEEDGNEERGAGKAWRAARPGWGTRSGRRRRRSTTRGPRSRSKSIHR